MLIEPRPNIFLLNLTNSGRADSERLCYFSLQHLSPERSYFQNFTFFELNPSVALPSIMGSMSYPISLIFRWGGPTNVRGGYASLIPIAARVRSLMQRCRRWPVLSLTNNSMGKLSNSVDCDLPISGSVVPEWPDNTFVSFIGKRIFKKIKKRSVSSRPTVGRPMPEKPSVMRGTERYFFNPNRVFATFYGTFSWMIGHLVTSFNYYRGGNITRCSLVTKVEI